MALPDLRFLLAALWCAALGGAVLLIVVGIRGVDVVPGGPPSRLASLLATVRRPAVGARLAGGALLFAAVLVLTRWPVAAAAMGALVLGWPALFGGSRHEQLQIARLEALVGWTEALRDTMAAHASLEQAIPATTATASPLLRPALLQLVGQLQARVPMDRALRQLAANLDDPSADTVIAALIMNVSRRGDRLGDVLSGLAVTAREELDLRRSVSAGRREIRRGIRIIIGITIGFGAYFTMFGGTYMRPYSTFGGQVALAAVCGMFIVGFLWLRKLAGAAPQQPFLARPGTAPNPDEVALVASLTDLSAPAPAASTRSPNVRDRAAGPTR